MIKLNIGCGMTKLEGYTRIDNDAAVEPNYVLDIERDKLPFNDNSVEEIYSRKCLEHVHDLTNFFEESYRVLNKDSGSLKLILPYYRHESAYTDPEHVWYFTPSFFDYLTRLGHGSDNRPIITGNFDWEVLQLNLLVEEKVEAELRGMISTLFGRVPRGLMELLAKYLWNIVREIEVTLKPIYPIRALINSLPPTYVRLRK